MERVKKLKILSALYTYKSFGLNYTNDIQNINQDNLTAKNLPNDLTQLENIVQNCHLCQLAKTRKNVVFGEGDTNADIMFIGEGPGANEDETGKPFVGRAGELLTKIIENVLEIKRDNVYIANIVKCRPPGNRVPAPEEVESCIPYLLKQINIINPKIIVTLGATAYNNLTNDTTPISKIRGEVLNFLDAKLIPTFHPSFLLRNPSAKKFVFMDMKKVKALLKN
jgi:DNA polymerase